MLERLDLAGLGRNEHRFTAGLLDRLPRTRQFFLLHTFIRDQERNSRSFQLLSHIHLSSRSASIARITALLARSAAWSRSEYSIPEEHGDTTWEAVRHDIVMI